MLAWKNNRPIAFSTTGFHSEMIESFWFWDKDNYDYGHYEIFSILSSARAWANVILAGKRGSRRHSTTSFSENVVVAGTSSIILWPGKGLTVSNKNDRTYFSGEKQYNEGLNIFREYAKAL